jgi:hypothetical protein
LNDLDLPSHVSREQIESLQAQMVTMPQAELVTEHQFSPGMYMRKMYCPADMLIVGKVHKEPHFFLCAKGEIIAWTESGMKRLQAGDVIESKSGTKRIILAVTDAIGVTIHKTDKTDLDEIEAELIEPDTTALFDSENKLKFDVPAFRELTQKVIAAEKFGFWSDWTKEEQELYTANRWREFSISRGYSKEEINDYALFLDKVQEAQKVGLNPYVFINDLTASASLKNIELDKKFEILKSSHLPFEHKGEAL